ncbi:MAG TPA: hypothetical protein VFU82_00680 [Gammaproteobacteria bacterium]|jgi:1,4-dihydroxy-2-naphthoate octaprenyltransferase|nr:hypothetical protein [Gammaproteobacteria bacterium]
MFMFHAAFALNLLALCAGCALFMFGASRCDCKGSCFAKLVAVIVIILAILSTACTINSGMKMWNDMGDQCKAGTCDNKAMMQTDAAQGNNDKPAAAKAKPARAHR